MSIDGASFWFGVAAVVLTTIGAPMGALAWWFSYKSSAIKEAALNLQISEANQIAAQANERAAQLEKEAANARLETERIKKMLNWRTMPPKLKRQLTEDLSTAPGKVYIIALMDDPESQFLAAQFREVFREAKWEVFYSSNRFDPGAHFMGVSVPDDKTTKDGAFIHSVFDKHNLLAWNWWTDSPSRMMIGQGPGEAVKPVARVVIGHKQPAFSFEH